MILPHHEQWRTVAHCKNADMSLALIEEWSVPDVETTHWGSPEILYSEDATQAKLWAAAFSAFIPAVAIASRVKLGIESDSCTVERLAFHVQRLPRAVKVLRPVVRSLWVTCII